MKKTTAKNGHYYSSTQSYHTHAISNTNTKRYLVPLSQNHPGTICQTIGSSLSSSNPDDVIIDTISSEDSIDDSTPTIEMETLLDLALKQNPEYERTRIPFIDPLGNNFIECKPHFEVLYNDVSYMIGTPHDHTVGICYTNESTGKIVFLSDNIIGMTEAQQILKTEIDNNSLSSESTASNFEEQKRLLDDVFKIASMELSKSFQDELKLRRTPGTLTLEGDLEKYINMVWGQEKNNQKGKQTKDIDDNDILMEKLLIETGLLTGLEDDEDADEDEIFDNAMRDLLGDVYDEEDNDEDEDNDIDPEILELFNGFDVNDKNDIQSIMNELMDTDDDNEALLKELEDTINNAEIEGNDDNDQSKRNNAYAETLLSFRCDDKLFSLVRMIQPAVIVGREDPRVESRRVLLTPQESLILLPKLEKMIKKELKDAGILDH